MTPKEVMSEREKGAEVVSPPGLRATYFSCPRSLRASKRNVKLSKSSAPGLSAARLLSGGGRVTHSACTAIEA
jgi:hypothetical protein